MTLHRRQIIKASTLLLAAPGIAAAASLIKTPSQTKGPFYPRKIPLDADADLTQVAGKGRSATGIPSHLMGTVTDLNGCAIQGAKIEIWQCDAFGVYHHPSDRGGNAEPEFQGYGHTHTNPEGHYRFKTIRPVSYPGRTPHIHVIVRKPGMPSLTTQLYVKDEAANDRDGLFGALANDKQKSLLAEFPNDPSETDLVIAEFNIVIGHTASCA